MTATAATPSRPRPNPFVTVPEIFTVTFRQLLGRRRTILLALLCLVPALLALLTVAAGTVKTNEFVDSVFGLIITMLLPIVAVLVGTAANGGDIEDGTVVYLLAKPIRRWEVALAKLFGSAIFVAVFALASVLLSGLIALPGAENGMNALIGFSVACVVGAFCYCALFVALSLITRRAMVLAFGYVFIWEALITSLMPGLSNFSVRRYCFGIAETFYKNGSTLKPETAWLLAGVLIVICVAISIRRLSRFQLSGSGD